MSAVQPLAVDRRTFLGGSDIAAVLGVSPWTTRLQLYQRKVNPAPEDNSGRKVKQRGKRWEAVVAEMLVEELESRDHKVEIVSANQRYQDSEFDYFACEIDFEIRLDGESDITNVELKTVHPFKTKEWGQVDTDEVPVWYTAQAMQGLGITNRRRCIVAPLFGADEIRTYMIERNDAVIAGMRQRGRDFWLDHVVPQIPPEPVNLDDLKILFPNDVPASIEADEETVERVLRMRSIDREIKAREAEWELLEYHVKRFMQGNTELLVRGKSAVTWKDKPYQYIDQDAMKERFPKVLKEVLVKDKSRQFSLKSFAWDRN